MIHSPFGTNKKQQRGNLNRTRDEESLLLQGRNYSDFGKQLQADEMSFSKSIHQGSIKRYQVKTDFKKHVENTSRPYFFEFLSYFSKLRIINLFLTSSNQILITEYFF